MLPGIERLRNNPLEAIEKSPTANRDSAKCFSRKISFCSKKITTGAEKLFRKMPLDGYLFTYEKIKNDFNGNNSRQVTHALVVNFEHVSHFALVFLVLNLNRYLSSKFELPEKSL